MKLEARLLFALVTMTLALGAIHPVLASCQTQYCQYRRALHGLEEEQELLRELEKDRWDPDLVSRWIAFLDGKPYRNNTVARWRERFNFEAEPWLVDSAAKARIREESQRWKRIYRQETGKGSCRISESVDPRVELDELQRSVSQNADSGELSGCLQQALLSVGRAPEAEAIAEAFLAAHPDDEIAWSNALRLHGKDNPGGRELQLLEARAERLPTLDHKLGLLAYFARHLLVGERDTLVATLETENLPPEEARRICWSLQIPGRRADNGAKHACELRLYERLAADSREEAENALASLRETLLNKARSSHDWERIETLLADWPRDHLLAAWSSLVDRTPEEACPRLIAALGEVQRTLDPAGQKRLLRHAQSLARLLAECSRDDLALATLSTYLPSPAGDLEAAKAAIEAAEARRKLAEDPHFRFFQYGHLSGPDSPLTLEERRQVAQRWAESSPRLVAPVQAVVATYGIEGLYDQAAAWVWQAAARHPENPDIPLTLGAAALRWQRQDLILEAAKVVEVSPHANSRHLAEAAYLEGRVARWQGRWEEAGGLLLRYFSQRQRYDACGTCDRGLLAHLTEAGDFERLTEYLEIRHEAMTEFEKRHNDPPRRAANGQILGDPPYRPSGEGIPSWASAAAEGDCVFPATLDYLERLAGKNREKAHRRFEKLSSAPLCPTAENLEVEEAFLLEPLSLAAALTRVD